MLFSVPANLDGNCKRYRALRDQGDPALLPRWGAHSPPRGEAHTEQLASFARERRDRPGALVKSGEQRRYNLARKILRTFESSLPIAE